MDSSNVYLEELNGCRVIYTFKEMASPVKPDDLSASIMCMLSVGYFQNLNSGWLGGESICCGGTNGFGTGRRHQHLSSAPLFNASHLV